MGPPGGRPTASERPSPKGRGSDSGSMGGFSLPGLGNALANLAQEQGSGSPMSPGQMQKEKLINKYKAPSNVRKGKY